MADRECDSSAGKFANGFRVAVAIRLSRAVEIGAVPVVPVTVVPSGAYCVCAPRFTDGFKLRSLKFTVVSPRALPLREPRPKTNETSKDRQTVLEASIEQSLLHKVVE